MRVIAGVARGTALAAPRGSHTRPITDRVKETLFGILGDRVLDARVLDLYAGSGAVGIEALSRGAAACLFVEQDRAALVALRSNLERSRLQDRAEVVADDVARFVGRAAAASWDLVVVDPPYAERAILAPLARLAAILGPGATVVVKHFWRTPPPPVPGLVTVRERRFGETMLTFLERARVEDGEGAGDR
jgi:16S rRNA (guanine966-N2)-methyltransferase